MRDMLGCMSRVKRIAFSCLQPGILFGILSCDAMYGHRILGAELRPRVPGSWPLNSEAYLISLENEMG